MKKINIILMAFALAITMSQCKKNEGQPTSNDEVVTITLDVYNGNGSRVVVNPATGTVDFESGDKIYVGSGGKYVGMLIHNGTNFIGNITDPMENQPLQFYFLGNVTPSETLSAGTTEECSVVISDQTEHLPVISCAASNENYVSGVTAYSAHLLNKCALVKFNVTTPSNSPICITGMHNKVTIDFANNTLTPSQDGEGVITLPAGSGENIEKWAILLPQEALSEGEEGSAYSEDGVYTGTRPEISIIVDNGYLAQGINVEVSNAVVSDIPIGAINGLFTINANGDQVYFSKGNLQYIGSASNPYWKFAENQWDYLGNNGQGSSSQTVDRDLFGWGTSGYHDSNDQYNVNYFPWSTSEIIVNEDCNFYGYGPSTNLPSPDLTGDFANYDWGFFNPINNGGNQQNQWRTLTMQEWAFVFDTRLTTSGIRYAKAQVNGVNGIILLPDDWNISYYSLINTNQPGASFSSNVITSLEWNSVEQEGAVFLPAAGYRQQNWIASVGSCCSYWSVSYKDHERAYYMVCEIGLLSPRNYRYRCEGCSVRLVKDCNP